MLSTIQASLQEFITSGAAALWLRLRSREAGVGGSYRECLTKSSVP
jgi:hypothetical protein